MAIDLQERPDSRSSTKDPPSFTYRYTASGEQNDSVVSAYALAVTPIAVSTSMGLLYRQDIRIDPVGWANYTVTVPYGPKKKTTGQYSFRFDTTGGTAKVTCAKEHIASFIDAGEVVGAGVNPHNGMIGVKKDGECEGCEVIVPALKFSVDYRHPQGVVTIAYMKHLSDITGKVNSDTFLTFAPGELVFVGASGGDGTEADAEVSYQFAGSANTTTLKFGDVDNITKKGWEYAWVKDNDAVHDDAAVVQAKQVFVERVYDSMNFASELGWS